MLGFLSNTLSKEFLHSMEHDGLHGTEAFRFRVGLRQYKTMMNRAPVINGNKEWFCSVCKTFNVWTWKKCRTCDERIPSCFFRFRTQASEEQQMVCYES